MRDETLTWRCIMPLIGSPCLVGKLEIRLVIWQLCLDHGQTGMLLVCALRTLPDCEPVTAETLPNLFPIKRRMNVQCPTSKRWVQLQNPLSGFSRKPTVASAVEGRISPPPHGPKAVISRQGHLGEPGKSSLPKL